MNNSDIIQHCIAGDREAMELLYHRYCHKMMRIIHRYISDRSTAEDLLHDGFIVIFTRIGEVRNPDRLEFWIAAVIRNLCINYLSDIDITTLLDDDIELPDTPDIEEILSFEELEDLINHLPDGYRRIFRLAVLDGKSHKEIGKLLGIAPHSSSSQLFHAKTLLKKMILERKSQLGLAGISLAVIIGGYLFFNSGGSDIHDFLISENPVISLGDITSEIADIIPDSIQHNIQIPVNTATEIKSGIPEQDITDNSSSAVPESTSAQITAVNDSVVLHLNRDDSVSHISPAVNTSGVVKKLRLPSAGSSSWSVNFHYALAGNIRHTGSGLYFAPSDPVPSDPDYPPGWYDPSITDPDTQLQPYQNTPETDHDMPLTFGITVSHEITPHMSIESGLTYSLLRVRLRYSGKNFDVRQNIRTEYIGIPVKLNYKLFEHSRFSLYGTAGGYVEFPVKSSVSTRYILTPTINDLAPEPKPAPQFSISGGLGLQYSIAPGIGIYTEPSVRYYFDNKSSLPSYWKDHNCTLSIPVGIRFEW